jgi:hypothetical protein
MVCALIASTGWAEEADWVSEICQGYTTNQYVAALVECSQNPSPDSYESLSASTVKTAVIAIFVLCLVIILVIFLIHIFAALRKRKNWTIVTRIVCTSIFSEKNKCVDLDRCYFYSVISSNSVDFHRCGFLGS